MYHLFVEDVLSITLSWGTHTEPNLVTKVLLWNWFPNPFVHSFHRGGKRRGVTTPEGFR